MSVRDLYFATMARICAAMEGFSEPVTAQAFGRLGRTLALVGLRAHGTDGPTIDRAGSGLPILKEAASVGLDLDGGALSDEDPEALRRQMLDFMMTRRRRPPAELSRRMAQAVYAKALRGCPSVFGAQPDALALEPAGPDACAAAWDFWDGVSSSPVHVACVFAAPTGSGGGHGGAARDAGAPAALRAARLFSGQAFDALALAREIDDEARFLRLRSLTKLVIGPFRSDVFTEGDDAIAALLRQLDDLAGAWAMGWSVSTVRSAGTAWRRTGFLGLLSRPYEKLVAEPTDTHMLLPHPAYQLLSDDPSGRAILAARRVHVLADGCLTEDA